eukprot:6550113-Lingulodinium_polyedra.AAC.1
MSKFWAYYPGLFCCLVSGSPVQEANALARMGEDWAAWQKAEEVAVRSAWWKRQGARSCMMVPVVKVLFEHAAAHGFRAVTPAMRAIIQRGFGGFGQTKVIEDLFGVARDRETRQSKHKQMGPQLLWHTLQQSHTLDANHKFQDSALAPELAEQGAGLPPTLHHPDKVSPAALSLEAKSLRNKATWPTFDAQSA